MQDLQSIDDVLKELDLIINRSVEENDFMGLFAYVYRRTTAEIRQGIIDEQFNNKARMELFDVIFAKLYIDAYKGGGQPSFSWLVCFELRNERISITQHILMGMNAHINLDLGIAAASVANGADFEELKKDFDKVNNIINNLIDEIQGRISRASKLLYLLDWLGGRFDEKYIDRRIRKYRSNAWDNACKLVELDSDEERKKLIKRLDDQTAQWSKDILRPRNILLRTFLKFISIFEIKDMGKIINYLRSDNKRLLKI